MLGEADKHRGHTKNTFGKGFGEDTFGPHLKSNLFALLLLFF